MGWSLEGLQIGNGNPQIFQTQGTQSLEAKHVTDDRGEHVGNRAFLEQIQGIGNVGDELVVISTGDWLNVVTPTLVAIQVSQQVCPHGCPCTSGRFRCYCRTCFFGRNTGLRSDPKRCQNIGIFGSVVWGVVRQSVIFYPSLIPRFCLGFGLRVRHKFLSLEITKFRLST